MSTVKYVLKDPAMPPEVTAHQGRYSALEPFDPARHLEDLWAQAQDDGIWTFMPFGPFTDKASFTKTIEAVAARRDTLYYAVIDLATGKAAGMIGHIRIKPEMATIEIGAIWFGGSLKKTRAATEAIYLSIAYPMDMLGYQRMEWKCDVHNAASQAAALRFGFTREGVQRQHMIIKGRSRDTAWFSIVDGDWPGVKARFERWLAPENFDEGGVQKKSLSQI
jgi:RimJ/RimL family protein N-acetyltransferase